MPSDSEATATPPPSEAYGVLDHSAWALTRRLLRRVGRHKKTLGLALVWMLVSSAAEVAPIALAKAAAGLLFSADAEAGDAAEAAGWLASGTERAAELLSIEVSGSPKVAALVFLVFLIIALGIFSAFATYSAFFFGRRLSAILVVDLRCALMQKVLQMPVAWFTKRKSGDLLSRFSTDVQQTYVGVNAFLTIMVHRAVILLFAVTFAFYLSWRLALASLVVLPLLIIPVFLIGRKAHRHSGKSLISLGEGTEAVAQSLEGLRVIRAFGAEAQEDQRYQSLSQDWLKRQTKLIRALAMGQGLMHVVYGTSLAVVIGLGGYLVVTKRWDMTQETFFGFLVALATSYRPLRQLTRAYNKWQASMAAAGRVYEILDTDPRTGPEGSRAVSPISKDIRFEDVHFSYHDEDEPPTEVLRGISFTIPAGQSVALVGPSGSGKSTIADLIFRFRRVDSGRVLIDGVPVEELEHDSLLSQIAVVSQRPFVFNTTIRENILYGRRDATDAEVEAAARAAQIHERIVSLPNGYDALVGNQGASLSGGEMQRITIARALLKNASFLLLDEATSSLDAESERAVQDALRNLMRDRTTLIIAHRLSTIVDVDRILVIQDGRLVEQGTHEELLRQDGTYARLFQTQQA